MKVEIKDNSRIVVSTMNGNVEAALSAMGTKAVNLIKWSMVQRYPKKIYDSGSLLKDVSYEVDMNAGNNGVVRVGNTLNYGSFVHEGTSRMKGRPYITDSLTGENHAKQLKKVAENELKKGFE